MIPSTFRRLSVIAAAALALAACGSHVKGKYASANGMMQIEFKDGKAYLTLPMAGTSEASFHQDGDKVTINSPDGSGNLVLTQHGDVLTGSPMGDLKKVDD